MLFANRHRQRFSAWGYLEEAGQQNIAHLLHHESVLQQPDLRPLTPQLECAKTGKLEVATIHRCVD